MKWEPIRPVFDELIHFPTRLRITAALASAAELEFSALEDSLGISTSLLSKQLKTLADAGYLAIEKRPQPFGRPRTWLRLTPAGKLAYLQHIEALKQLVGDEAQNPGFNPPGVRVSDTWRRIRDSNS